VQQPCKFAAADFEKNAKNRFHAFFIPVQAQRHSCWYRLTENACLGCPVLLCKFQFPRFIGSGNITDLFTSYTFAAQRVLCYDAAATMLKWPLIVLWLLVFSV